MQGFHAAGQIEKPRWKDGRKAAGRMCHFKVKSDVSKNNEMELAQRGPFALPVGLTQAKDNRLEPKPVFLTIAHRQLRRLVISRTTTFSRIWPHLVRHRFVRDITYMILTNSRSLALLVSVRGDCFAWEPVGVC